MVVRATRQILERLDDSTLSAATRRDEGVTSASGTHGALRVFACPARDDADEVALVMFRALCEPSGARVRVASAAMLSSEVVAVVGEQPPDVVLVAGIAPGGLSQTRYLCKRLRAAFPEVPIVVGRWSRDEDAEQMRTVLMAAGATEVGFTLMDTRRLILQYARARTPLAPNVSA